MLMKVFLRKKDMEKKKWWQDEVQKFVLRWVTGELIIVESLCQSIHEDHASWRLHCTSSVTDFIKIPHNAHIKCI